VKQLVLPVAAALLAACSPATAGNTPNPTRGSAPLTPIVTSADPAVGPMHFGLALLDDRNQPIADAPVHLVFYDLSEPEPKAVMEADAVWRRPGSEWTRGVYKADVSFDHAGPYGAEATITRADGNRQTVRTRFDVHPQSATPPMGAPAPRSNNLTVRDPVDPIELCTASAEVCAATAGMRQLTVAEAIAQGRPVVVLFATPGFCTSQTCGPQLEVLQGVASHFRDRANFIHVEIFKDPQSRTINSTVTEWNLPSEPWTFVVDGSGTIADKFDGITTAEEIERSLQRLLS
jgi:hypothetical protein